MATNTGKSKQKKKNVRVDFTPMVDMNMLLITFFMLCTSLVKPQTMELAMPSNDKDIQDQDRSEVKASQAVTLLLDAGNKIYYYEGQPNTEDPKFLKTTDYSANGLRGFLQKKNLSALEKKYKLDQDKLALKVSDEDYKKELSKIKGADGTPTIIIRAFKDATYKNLVDALDEMQICAIGKYVIDKIGPIDVKLVKNLTGVDHSDEIKEEPTGE
ncbi:MAG: biopolymer transporter ExbD [Prevotellaceae bacterium]|nr:biopolymer transporter ExbD [Prevotellaceae bacterium]